MNEQAISATAIKVLVIDGFGRGEIVLSESGGEHVEGTLTSDSPVEVLTQGAVLKILGDRRSQTGRLQLAIPPQCVVSGRLGSASLTARVPLSQVDLRSGSGAVTLTEATTVSVSTGSGAVHVDRVNATAGVRTGSGSILLGEATDRVSLRSGSGNIQIGTLHGLLQGRTGSGNVGVQRLHHGGVDVRSASGRVAVGVPEGTTAWLDLRSAQGWIDVELDQTAEPAPDEPTVAVQVMTAAGDIRITRAAAAENLS